MARKKDHLSDLVVARLTLAPSNQGGHNVVATISFGETVVRLPHRTLRFSIDACYLNFAPALCDLPDHSWAFDDEIASTISITRTIEDTTASKTSRIQNFSSKGNTNTSPIELSTSRGTQKDAESRASHKDEFTFDARTITAMPSGTGLTWKVVAPPGSSSLIGKLVDETPILVAIPKSSGAELALFAEIPRSAINVASTRTSPKNGNKAGLSRLLLGLKIGDRSVEIFRMQIPEIPQ